MASFHEVQFPTDMSYGSMGGPGYLTSIFTLDGGAEERVARISRPRRRYDARYGIKTYTQLLAVRDFYVARYGPAHGFRYKDWLDFSTDPSAAPDSASSPSDTDVLIGTGDGSTTDFQLVKKYTSGINTVSIPISKPVSGTTVVSLDDVSQASGWVVNTATGVVTFATAPAAGQLVKAGCDFDIPVRFGEEVDQALMLSAETFSTGGIGAIPLVEDIDGSTQPEDFIFRGGKSLAFSLDVSVTANDGCALFLDPAGAGLSVYFPEAADLVAGGPHYFLYNNGSDSVTLKTDTVTIGTLAAGEWGTLVIFDVSGTNTWKGLTA
jgi:uncharacterized protein (TIGR02217 family)